MFGGTVLREIFRVLGPHVIHWGTRGGELGDGRELRWTNEVPPCTHRHDLDWVVFSLPIAESRTGDVHKPLMAILTNLAPHIENGALSQGSTAKIGPITWHEVQ